MKDFIIITFFSLSTSAQFIRSNSFIDKLVGYFFIFWYGLPVRPFHFYSPLVDIKNAKLKLKRWYKILDPWPLNSFAIQAGIDLLSNKIFYQKWINTIHEWINSEKSWLRNELSKINNLKVYNPSPNFFLIDLFHMLS